MIDDPILLNFLQNEEARATDTTLNEERKTALEFYRGDLFGDEVEGRSKLRTRDVAEVVDYMLASVLRTLVSGDRVVEFEPSNPGQEDIATQITDRIHWNFLREQDGYAVLRDGIKAGLLEKSGIWKSWSERPRSNEQTVLNAADIEEMEAAAENDRNAPRVIRAVPIEDAYDVSVTEPEPGVTVEDVVQLYDVTISVAGQVQFKDAAIPNDEFFVAPDARLLDTAIYLGNISRVSLFKLMEMGYSEEDVSGLWGDGGNAQELRDARDEGRSEKESNVYRPNLSRIVTLREEYVRYDWDGVYQLVRVHRVNTSILSVEPVKSQPYTLWSPFPMQHRLIGQSIADKTMDIQVVRSHMLRQAMDALYIANAPRLYVDMSQADETTIDDALDVAPGGMIRGQGPNAVTPLTQPFAAQNAFEAMEVMAGEKESRTGITRLNQGLDADALNKTATGTALMQASGQQMEEMVAREAANAVGEIFEKKLGMMIAEMQPHEFRIDGKPVQMDPSQWPTDLRLAVRVGLGSGNKDKKLQGIALLKQSQAEAIQVDPRLVAPQNVFETAKLVTATLGLGPATQFFTDPATFGPQQEQQDPEVIKAQTEAQLKQQDMQAKQQESAQKLQLSQQEAAAKLQLQQQESEAKIQLMREDAAAKLQFERDKAAAELQNNQLKMQAEIELAREKMRMEGALQAQRNENDAKLSTNRPGGDLDK